MNYDQQVLYHFAKAANTGPSYFIGHPEPRTAAPGHMHNARWITRANWVLRLYFSTENPEKNLVKLVNFLTQINILAWFDVVEKPNSKGQAVNHGHMAGQDIPSSMQA